MKACVCCWMLLLSTFSAFPCLWVMGTKYSGMRAFVSGLTHDRVLRMQMKANRHPDGAKMEAELRGATEFTNRSDYCVALLYLGRTQEAVEGLEQLEREQPGLYYIAANLGTAHELAGNNTEALRWIKEGIRRNPTSHADTEWLHVKIIEAKIAQAIAPDYFKKHSVLNLDPDRINEGITVEGRHIVTSEIATAIKHQLMERMEFVKPPDPAVASLLYDYASIDATRNSLESAVKVLRLSIEYGYPADQAQAMIGRFDRRVFWAKTVQYILLILAAGLLVWFLRALNKRGIFVLSRRNLKRG